MIWLIGNKGMLGTEIARQLTEKNIAFVGTDREVDITDVQALESFALSTTHSQIKWIINCSAYTAVDKAETDVELATKLNVEGPRNIATVAKKIGATMIHISTDYVFDGTGKVPYTEDMELAPLGVYGRTKAAGEQAMQAILSDNFYILRTAWLYGWAGKNFVYTMVKNMNIRDSMIVVNDQFGTPTFAGDIAFSILRIIELNESNNSKQSISNETTSLAAASSGNTVSSGTVIPYGIYHCTDLGLISWYDFALEIQRLGLENGLITHECKVNPCKTAEYPSQAVRPAYSVLCKDKIQKALNYKLPDWKESLKKFMTSPFWSIK